MEHHLDDVRAATAYMLLRRKKEDGRRAAQSSATVNALTCGGAAALDRGPDAHQTGAKQKAPET